MKNQKGITLLSVIITVILLAIIGGIAINSGVDTYESSKVAKFETYMKMLQKKVDLMIEEGVDYTTIGSTLTSAQQTKLQTILNNDTNNYIDTTDATLSTIRYFSSNDLKTHFDIENVEDEIVINFANREVISLNGIEKDDVMYYVEYGLH